MFSAFRKRLRTSTVIDDSELINRFLETGDQLSFELLVNRYKDRVYHLILSILGPQCVGKAEEAAQDVFLIIWVWLLCDDV